MMRRLRRLWIVGAHAIALLGWMLLGIWIVSHIVEFVVEFPDPTRIGNRDSLVLTDGAVGFRSTSIWFTNERAIDVRLYFTDFEFDRWLPLRRVHDFRTVWESRLGQGGYRNLLWRVGPPGISSTVVPLLPFVGVCFLISLVRVHVPITYWSWLRVAVGIVATTIVLGCVGLVGIGIIELVQYANGKSTLLLATARGSLLGQRVEFTCDAIGTVTTFNPPKPTRSMPPTTTVFQLRLATDPTGTQPASGKELLARLGPGFSRSSATTISLPNWLLLVAGAILFRWCTRFLRIERRPGYCRKCSYDLTGNVSGVCPECGTRVPQRGASPWAGTAWHARLDRFGRILWLSLKCMAILIICADLSLLVAVSVKHASGTPDPLGFPSIVADWLIWRIAFLTLLGVSLCVPLRRFEPPGMTKSRAIFAANLLWLLVLAWPKV